MTLGQQKKIDIPHSALIRRSAGKVGEGSAEAVGLKLVNVGDTVSELRCRTGCCWSGSLCVVVPCVMVLGAQDGVVVLVVSMVMGALCCSEPSEKRVSQVMVIFKYQKWKGAYLT